ncbi:MAG: PaaX family transcriptional regulator C-terminal domain-containing protein [Solirubrobacteraceae bacterium]
MHNLNPDRATGQVFFVLGLALAGRADTVPGPVLITLLSDLGLSESAARAAILRLRRRGWLISQRHGRHTRYAPTAAILTHQQRFQEHFTTPSAPWDGAFHGLLYEVPERDRAFRDHLRRSARILGYARLRAGLLIAPTDRSAQLHTLLSKPPLGANLLPVRIELSPRDARPLAARLWALDALGDDYRTHIQAMHDATDVAAGEPLTGPQALRGFAAAIQPVYETIARDPLLPPELLPESWPASRLRAAFAATLQALGPAAVKYAATLAHRPPPS